MRREDSAGEATLRGGCRMCSMGRSTCTVQVSLTRATTISLLCFYCVFRFLENKKHFPADYWHQKKVVDVGSGTGVGGLAAGTLG